MQSVNVKNVSDTMSHESSPEPTPSETSSVNGATYLLAQRPEESGSVKITCTNCKVNCEGHWQMLRPMPIKLDPDIEFAHLTKRLLFCTNCGNLSLKK